jgi:hypothetical protein
LDIYEYEKGDRDGGDLGKEEDNTARIGGICENY